MTLVSLRGHTEPILALGMIAPDKEDLLSEHDILYSCALVCTYIHTHIPMHMYVYPYTHTHTQHDILYSCALVRR